MSRSGYIEDFDRDDGALMLGRWRAQVASALRGKRGQCFLLDLVTALDALPEKKLVKGELEDGEGAVCAIGSVARLRAIALEEIDTYDYEQLSSIFDIAEQLAQETMHVNDDAYPRCTDEARWGFVRAWALRHLHPETLIGEPELVEEP